MSPYGQMSPPTVTQHQPFPAEVARVSGFTSYMHWPVPGGTRFRLFKDRKAVEILVSSHEMNNAHIGLIGLILERGKLAWERAEEMEREQMTLREMMRRSIEEFRTDDFQEPGPL